MNSAALYFVLTPPLKSDGDNRLDKLLAEAVRRHADSADSDIIGEHDALSRARLQNLIKQGHVRVQGTKITDPAYKLKHTAEAELLIPPPTEPNIAAVAMDLAIVYEDEDVLVVDKPAGLTTHPGAGNHSHTLVNGLLHYCGQAGGEGGGTRGGGGTREGGGLSSIGGVARPGIVHRLDKDTGGLLAVAKNDAAHHHLAAQFAAHSIGRRYKALVCGVPKPLSGTIDKPIGRHPKDRKRMLSGARGKHAITDYRTCEVFGSSFALLECRLHTGRTHQIRAHLADLGHALVGDKTYGKSLPPRFTAAFPQEVAESLQNFKRQALHAEFLSFIHPKSGETCEFHSDLPADFAALLALCRKIS